MLNFIKIRKAEKENIQIWLNVYFLVRKPIIKVGALPFNRERYENKNKT